MNKQTVNLFSNYVGKTWSLLSVYLFVPLYIKVLGAESYGVISLYTLFFGIVGFADAGFSSAITREFARVNVDHKHKLTLLFTFERIYALVCLIVVSAIFLLAETFSSKWLKSAQISQHELSIFIKLISIGVGFQMISGIYAAGLIGLHKHLTNNSIQFGWSIAKSLGVIALMLVVGKNLYVFLGGQVVCNVLYAFFLRRNLLKEFHATIKEKIVLGIKAVPKEVWKYISSMILIAILSALNIQADKIITSSFFTLSDFGYYNLASIIAQIPFLIASPIAIVVFPILTAIVTDQKKEKPFVKTYREYTFLVSTFVIPVSVFIFLFGNVLVGIWAKYIDLYAVSKVAFATKFLSIGGCFLALQLIPYYTLLAKAKTKYTVWQSLIQLLLLIPLFYYFIKKYNFFGVPLPWLIVNFLSFVYLLIIIGKVFFKEAGYKNVLLSSYIIPIVTSLAIALVFFLIGKIIEIKGLLILPVGAVFLVIVNMLNIFFYNQLNCDNSIRIFKLISRKK